MMVVDAQVHVWTGGRIVTPANAHHLQNAIFSADDLAARMDEAGVDRAVLVPPQWTDNRHAHEAARRYPDRFAVMGRIALDDPASRDLLSSWRQAGLRGFRLVFNAETRGMLTEGHADWFWPAAEAAGVPVAVLAPGLLGRIDQIAGRHSGLRLTIDHLGCARHAQGEAAFGHLPELIALAHHSNVAVKASGMPRYSAQPFPYTDVIEPLRRVFDAFGPERFFWGTDLTRMPCPYQACVRHFTEHLPFLSYADKESIMGRALCTWLDWPAPDPPSDAPSRERE